LNTIGKIGFPFCCHEEKQINIFFLDWNPQTAAQYHCDKHCVKMILEGCQILSTVARERYGLNVGYRSGWKHHPCTKWAAEYDMNFYWLCRLTSALCEEYTYRYGKHHKCEDVLGQIVEAIGSIVYDHLSYPYLAMPDDCKLGDPVESYRQYYLLHKQHLLTYTKREIPEWIQKAGLGTWKEGK